MLLKQARVFNPKELPEDFMNSPTKALMKLKTFQPLSDMSTKHTDIMEASDPVINSVSPVKESICDRTTDSTIRLRPAVKITYPDGESTDDDNDPDYVEEGKASSEILKYTDKFICYMSGPDRGRDVDSVTTAMDNVKRISRTIGANSLTELFDPETDNLRHKYLNGYCKKKGLKATAVRTYLYSLKDFCNFLLKSRVLHSVPVDDLKTAKRTIKLWRKNYETRAQEQTSFRQEEDFEHLISKEQILEYYKTDVATNSRNLIEKAANDEIQINQQNFVAVRDFVLMIIILANGCRSGVVGNFLMEEFWQAKAVPEGILYRVKNHKTKVSKGYAMFILNKKENEYLKTYVHKVRPYLPPIDEKVFLTWTGTELNSGTFLYSFVF